MILDVLASTGITATAGIGTNLYLCKVAMDIVAKHIPADKNGVRIAELDEMSYRRTLWSHRPLTDFWRVGRGYAKKLEANGLFTMGDVARCSIGKPTVAVPHYDAAYARSMVMADGTIIPLDDILEIKAFPGLYCKGKMIHQQFFTVTQSGRDKSAAIF